MFTSLPLLLLSTVAFTQAHSNNISASPVPVTLYYETLCPYSERFIVNKLVPTYNDKDFNFARLLENLELVPYGHVYNVTLTHVDNPNIVKYEYMCQHGVPECEGNKLHGCAVKYIEEKSILLNYISCLMNTTQNAMTRLFSYPVKECKNLVPSDKMQLISKCYNSNEASDLFNKHGITTDNVFGLNRFFVPYLSFNHIKDDKLALEAKKNFKKMLCVQNGVNHTACSDHIV